MRQGEGHLLHGREGGAKLQGQPGPRQRMMAWMRRSVTSGDDKEAAFRRSDYQTGRDILWFAGAALLFSVIMYGLAEIVASRVPSPEA